MRHLRKPGRLSCRGTDDREDDRADAEPTLGWSANMDQSHLGVPFSDGDNEPELGWTEKVANDKARELGWIV
jgi:hypothetical protein